VRLRADGSKDAQTSSDEGSEAEVEEEEDRRATTSSVTEQPAREDRVRPLLVEVTEAEMRVHILDLKKTTGMRQRTIAKEAEVNEGQLSKFVQGTLTTIQAETTLKKLNVWRARRPAESRKPANNKDDTSASP
jgi:hypothetical protein